MKFTDKLRGILKEKNISINRFSEDTGICKNVFYKYNGRVKKAYHKATLIAISCYLGIAVEELIEGTDAEDSWYK